MATTVGARQIGDVEPWAVGAVVAATLRWARALRPRASVVGLVLTVVIAVVALALVPPSGFTVVAHDDRAGTVWLASSAPGHLALVDGATGEVTVRVAVASPGDDIAAVQGRGAGFALDRTTGGLVRVDSGTWDSTVRPAMVPGATSTLDAVASAEALFVLDRDRGLMVEADPVSLRPRGPAASLSASPSPGSPAVDRAGALWLLDDRTGDVVRAQGSEVGVTETAVAGAGSGRLVLVEGAPVVVDLAARRAVVIDGRSGRAAGPPACVDIGVGDDTVRVAGSDSASEVYAVSGADGVLRVTDVSTGACHAVVPDVAAPGSDLGVPIEESGRLFVPDYGTGQVVVVDLTDLLVVAVTEPIVTPGAPFELLSRDGFVFYNDPASERAGTIALDGGVREVAKYDPESPGDDVHVPGDDAPAPPDQAEPAAEPPETATDAPTPTGSPTQPTSPSSRPPTADAGAGRSRPSPSESRAAPEAPDSADDLEIVLAADPVARSEVGLEVRARRGSGVTVARWGFGDGSPAAEGASTTHRWARAGPYEVVADVTRDGGAQQSVRSTVVVLPDARGVVFTRTGGPGALLVARAGQAPQACDPACAFDAPTGTEFELSAQTSGAERLVDWGVPGCAPTASTCTFTLEDAEAVTVSFGAVSTLTVVVVGPGTVNAAPAPPDGAGPCTAGQCVWTYPADSPVVLTAATSAVFVGWSGACTGTSTCSLTVAGAGTTATASFRTIDTTPPAVTLAGGGRSVAVGSGGQTVALSGQTMSVTLTATATDPQGAVTATEIWVSRGHSCEEIDGDLATNVGPGLAGRPSAAASASSISFTVDFSTLVCPDGWRLASADAAVWAEAVSEGGRAETSMLTVSWRP